MAFVNERFPMQPEDSRTVDYERNAILKVIEGLPHGGGAWFNLFWQEQNIHFGAYKRLNGYVDSQDEAKGLRVLFSVFQIRVPEALESQKDEIKAIISDALSEYRAGYRYANIAEVQVNFDQCSYYQG